MTVTCKVCGQETISDNQQAQNITYGICEACAVQVSSTSNRDELLEAIHAPVLLMQSNPRQVVSANRMALKLFNKELHEVADRRGGQVFECIHSYTEVGCGKDVHCENCKIKIAIVDTFNTGNAHAEVSTPMPIRKANGIQTYVLQVSTEKVGDLALVRVERYDDDECLQQESTS